jgi:FkbM family methyltransferase
VIENNNQKIIFDVGANIGDYTIKLRESLTNPKIYCFEPSKSTYNDLKNNTNTLSGVVYINKGLGESEKEITLYKNSKVSALASIYNRNLNHLDITFDEKEIIEITTLDKFCLDNEIHNIDYLKLDVEGNELNAFVGAKNMLSNKKIKHIQFEMGGCNIDSKTSWLELYNILKPNYNI